MRAELSQRSIMRRWVNRPTANARRALPCARTLTLASMSVGLTLSPVFVGSGSVRPAAASTVSPPGSLPQQDSTISKVLVIMEENHSIGQVFPSQMPYLWSLARQFRASNFVERRRPSEPAQLPGDIRRIGVQRPPGLRSRSRLHILGPIGVWSSSCARRIRPRL